MNQKIYKELYKDHFSILAKTRASAKEFDLPESISIGIAMGSNDFRELYDKSESLINLALNRGGDQVVVSNNDNNILYFGGNSEAREKQSKTKVRVIYNSLKDLFTSSSNVIILGHKQMDADCLGAMLLMGSIINNYDIPCYLVTKSGGMEEMISGVLNNYSKVLNNKFNFVSEAMALDSLNKDSLVILLDHHLKSQSSSTNLIGQAKKLVIIDHHRRQLDLDFSPLLSYIQPSASSTCELICEFLPFISSRFEVSEEVANIAYIGMSIDTDNFRLRTGVRTFDVLKLLRSFGADPSLCNELVQEPYKNVKDKALIMSKCENYRDDILIATVFDNYYSRAIASQACDSLIKSKDIMAAFVICNISKEEVAITARSKGEMNVQTILETIGGGGHMYAAGLQRKESSVKELKAELIEALDNYLREEK